MMSPVVTDLHRKKKVYLSWNFSSNKPGRIAPGGILVTVPQNPNPAHSFGFLGSCT